MGRRNPELWAALVAIILITLVYMWMSMRLGFTPEGSSFVGHGLGVVGFLLMLMTETLYSLRKRSRSARWGRMALWLQFHIFTGLVGPYMVLLHTAWQFNGLAGMAMLLTMMIVASGFIGRYIYTAVPRTADGIELNADQLKRQIAASEKEWQHWLAAHPEMGETLGHHLAGLSEVPRNKLLLVMGRTYWEWRYHLQWWREKQRLRAMGYRPMPELGQLLKRRRTLQRQATSLAAVRQILALWHSLHVPLGVSPFTIAFLHIGAALYYATLLK